MRNSIRFALLVPGTLGLALACSFVAFAEGPTPRAERLDRKGDRIEERLDRQGGGVGNEVSKGSVEPAAAPAPDAAAAN